MRLSATLSVVVGAGVGVVAAAAAYTATSGQSASPSPLSTVAAQAVTATVTPAPQATCDDGTVLQHDVCVITVDRTTVLPLTADSGSRVESAGDGDVTADGAPVRSDEHAEDVGDGAGDHQRAEHDDHDDHGQRAEHDDRDDDHGQHGEDVGDRDDD